MTDIALHSVAATNHSPTSVIAPVALSSRTPTLEANRPAGTRPDATRRQFRQLLLWLTAQFRDQTIPDDETQRLIKEKNRRIAKRNDVGSWAQRFTLHRLLSDYEWIKNIPCQKVVPDLVQVWTFSDGTDTGGVKSLVKNLSAEENTTFSTFTTEVVKNLSEHCPNSLKVIALAKRADRTAEHSFLTAWHKIWATITFRIRSLPLVPGKTIALVVEETLGLSFDFDDIHDPDIGDARRRLFLPPTKRPSVANIDPDQSENDRITLKWERHPLPYVSDMDIYMREPQRKFSSTRRAEIRIWPIDSAIPSTNESVMVIYFDHYDSLRTFTKTREQLTDKQADASSPGQLWCKESEILSSIHALSDVLVSDTVCFLQECSIELERMAIKARFSPTSSKIRYLLHLNDQCKMACDAIIHASKILHNIKTWKGTQSDASTIWDAGVTWSKRVITLNNELGFLRKQLQIMEKEIKDLQQILRQRLELSYNRRDFLLTLVAAVYLPLSFATSFFGMNISTSTPPTESGFSNYTSDWIAHSPLEYQNTTKALVSTIGTSGTLTYSWKIFYISAACLLLTLPLSLAFGFIVRNVYRGTIHYARYWRLVTVPGLAAVFFFSVAGLQIFNYSWTLFIICNTLFALYAYISAYNAWRKSAADGRKMNAFHWTLVSVVITACFLVEVLDIADGITLIPWTYTFFMWFIPWIKRRRERNR